jgi:hypothetical protein
MFTQKLRVHLPAFAFGLGIMLTSGWALADPPQRAVRLGSIEGQVSFSPVGFADWVQPTVNRTLTTGDRLWADAGSRVELQIGGAAIRLGEFTDATLLNVDDNITQVQLTQGTIKLHVRHVDPNQILEIDTPNLALTLHKPGDYRLDVSPNGDATEVTVQNGGEAEVYGDSNAYSVQPGQGYRFYGVGLTDYEYVPTRLDDDLDRWASLRDRRADASASVRYVSSELVGYEDLDANGTWRVDPTYGNVWSPNSVATGWAPYHDGHWAWVNPWGWTWVDAAPWGYAVSHYGRWAHIRGAWAWVPGPIRERAVFAPALVVFVGGSSFQGGAVGWFPLAPREIYQPSYRVSQNYFDHINRSNAVIAPTTINNFYNTNITNVTNVTHVTYINRSVAGAVVAVPMHAFAQSLSVTKSAMPLPQGAAINAQVTNIAAIAPVVQSVRGGGSIAHAMPPAHEEHRVIARTAPPTPEPTFFAQQPLHGARPATRSEPAPVTVVKVVNTTKVPVAAAVPPPAAQQHRKPEDERKPDFSRGNMYAPPRPAPEAPKAFDQKMNPAASQAEAAKAAAMQAEKMKEEAARNASAKAQSDRSRVARDEETRIEASKSEAAKAELSRAAVAKADADRSRVARDEAARANAVRQESTKREAMQQDAARAQAERAKAEAARHTAPQAEPQRAPLQARPENKREHTGKPEDKRDKFEDEKRQ